MKITKEEAKNLLSNTDIEGVFTRDGKTYIDRRYTVETITRLGLSPRNADLNIIGDEIIELPVEFISPGTEGDV